MTPFAKILKVNIVAALHNFNLPSDESVITLLMMIAAHESRGFVCVKQFNGGPALGYFQMEPPTHKFVQGYLLRTGKFPDVPRDFEPEHCAFYLSYAVAMARVYLWTEPTSLPDANDLEALAVYASKFWNRGGKGEAWEYLNDYHVHVLGKNNVH